MLTIRDYIESDAEALWKLFFNTIRNINSRDYTQAQIEAWAPNSLDSELWQKRMDGLSPFVAEIDSLIVGYTDLQSDGLIDHFFCNHKYQRQGVGRALMNHVLEVGKSRELRRFYSEVSITARPFYENFGFTVAKEKALEMRGQKLRNFVMEKFS